MATTPAKPIGSLQLKDGSFKVSYDDGTSKNLSALQAQKAGVLPSNFTGSQPSIGADQVAGGYGGNNPAFGGTALGGAATTQSVYDPQTGTAISGNAGIPQKDPKTGAIIGYKPIKDFITESRANIAQVRNSMVKNGFLGKNEKTLSRIQSQWVQVLIGAQATQQDPYEYMASMKAQGFGQNAPVNSSRITDYSKVADGYVYQTFNKVFNRNPTAMDMQSPYKDSKGKTLTWQQALINESRKPENAEVTVTTVNPDGSLKNQIVTPGFDAQVWLQRSMTNAYADAIKGGKSVAKQSDIDKYNQLAVKYGINTVDPTTKQLDINARMNLANLENGTLTFDNVESNFRNAALAKYGYLKPQLDAGLTPYDVAKPAIDTVSKLLEKNPALVTLDDPYVQKYLKGDGKTTMNQGELEAIVRQDPSWKYTQNAHAQLDDLASSVLQRFGVNA